MYKRKKNIVNFKIQVLSSLKFALISVLPIAVILGIVLLYSHNYQKNITGNLVNLKEAVTTEDNIIQAYLEIARVYKDKNLRLAANNVRNDHEKSVAVINEHIPAIEKQTQSYNYFIYSLCCLLIIYGVFVFMYVMRYTHRIYGPAFVIHEAVKCMLDNKTIQERNLRKGDEFKELHADVVKLGKKKY